MLPELSLAMRHLACHPGDRARRASANLTYLLGGALNPRHARPLHRFPCAITPTSFTLRQCATVKISRYSCRVEQLAIAPVLREGPLSRQWNVTTCFSYAGGRYMGKCNYALAKHEDRPITITQAMVWVPSVNDFLRQSVSYPVRDNEIPDPMAIPAVAETLPIWRIPRSPMARYTQTAR